MRARITVTTIASPAAVFAFALIAASSGPAVAQVRTPTHVACVGDSITAGYAASSTNRSYPSVLQGLFGAGVQVRNFGHSGATLLSVGDLPYINQTAYASATTFVQSAGSTAVVDVIIMLGTNDSKSYNWMSGGGTRAQQFMTDLAAMVDHFTSLPTRPVVFLALPPAIYTNTFGISESVTFNQIAPIIQQVAAQKGTPLIDVHAPTAGHSEYFSDGVHPTDAGYAIVAQIMHDGLLRPLTGAGGAGGGAGRGGAGGSSGAAGSAGRGGSGGAGGAGGTGGSTTGRGGSNGGAGASGGNGGGGAAGGAGRGGTGGASAGTGGSAAGTGGAAGGGGGSSGAGGAGGASAGAGGAGSGGTGPGTAGSGAGTGGSGANAGTGGANAGTGGAGMSSDDGGCACSTAPVPRGGLIAAFVVIGVVLERRRRRVAPPKS